MTTTQSPTIPLETHGLGKRYGGRWALRDCTLAIPPGGVTALIGPNGAGKSTFLRLAVGLATPSSGAVAVFGADPRAKAAAVLPRIGFVAQDRPLYPRLTVAEMCEVAARLNRGWDRAFARGRLAQLGIDPRQKAGKLSGGEQSQVALVLALAKHPDLILLDEPTASLDPRARRAFLQVLMEAVATDGTTVVLSSHNVQDLERVCDRLVILSRSHVLVSEEIETFLGAHRFLIGPRAASCPLPQTGEVIQISHTDRQTTALVRTSGSGPGVGPRDARWEEREVDFEELVLGYLESAGAPLGDAPDLDAARTGPSHERIAS